MEEKKSVSWLLCNMCDVYYKGGYVCPQCVCVKCFHEGRKECNLECTADKNDLSLLRIPVLTRTGCRLGCDMCNLRRYNPDIVSCMCYESRFKTPQLTPVSTAIIYLTAYLQKNSDVPKTPDIEFLKRLKSTPDSFNIFNSLLTDKYFFKELCILASKYYTVLATQFDHDTIGIIIAAMLEIPDNFVYICSLLGDQEFLWLN